MKAKTLIGRSTFSRLPALKISAPSAKRRQRKFNMANENQMDQGPAVSPQVRQKAERGGTHPPKAGQYLGSPAGTMANEYLRRPDGGWDDALPRVRRFQDDRKQYVRD